MKFENIIINEISQSQRTDTVLFHSYEVPSVAKFIEAGSRMVIAGEKEWGVGL